MLKGKSPEFKKTVFDCIHEGLIVSFGIADWDRFQRIVEIEKDDYETPPEKTDGFMIIEITMFRGRTKEQKKKLIENITSKLVERLGINSTDVFIVIQEPENENWGLAGKQKEQR